MNEKIDDLIKNEIYKINPSLTNKLNKQKFKNECFIIDYKKTDITHFGFKKINIDELNFNGFGIYLLPEIFVNIKIKNSLNLVKNQISKLPESFENLEIGGNLNLKHYQ